MHMTREQFDQAHLSNRLVITFVGMSNLGKTHWARNEFAKKLGFRYIGCDDRIEAILTPELKAAGYGGGIADVSRWMGQPYDERYAQHQQRYLEIEADVTREALVEVQKTPGNTAIDTTGSVIHLDPSIGEELKQKTLVVGIRATEDRKREMYEKYIKELEPVCFGSVFTKLPDETNEQALARSYLKLLEVRSGLYEQLADIMIPREEITEGMELSEFINLVHKHCELSEHEREFSRR
ncbi:hypothetical protein HZA86_04110 [Candidatus Uhrbacteria bacterium]|nr:hypothetical protein [Candidatus Uhrbacteria bacterium]